MLISRSFGRLFALIALSLVAACSDSAEPTDRSAALDVTAIPTQVDIGDTVVAPVGVLDDAGRTLAGRTATLTSSSPAVLAVLADGRLVGVAAGNAVVHAAAGSGEGALARDVTVAVGHFVRTIAVSVAVDSVFTGDSTTVRASALDRRGVVMPAPALRFTSSDTSIATVDSLTGKLKAFNDGAVTISARLDTLRGSVTVRTALWRVLLPGAASSVTMSPYHACALVTGGDAYCWGNGGSAHALGTGDSGDLFSLDPLQVPGGYKYATIDADLFGTCALGLDASVYCWGGAYPGTSKHTPTRVTFGDGTQVAASVVAHGDGGACIIDTARTAWCWGSNHGSQFGVGTDDSRFVKVLVPTPLPGSYRWASFKPGINSSCGITTDGALLCAGGAGYYAPGTNNSVFSPAVTPTPVTQVTVGWDFSCVLDVSGVASCGGHDLYYQLGRPTPGNNAALPFAPVATTQRFVAVKAQYENACALTATGELWCWGYLGRAITSTAGATSTPRLYSRNHRFVSFAVGSITACGVEAGGDVYCGTRKIGFP